MQKTKIYTWVSAMQELPNTEGALFCRVLPPNGFQNQHTILVFNQQDGSFLTDKAILTPIPWIEWLKETEVWIISEESVSKTNNFFDEVENLLNKTFDLTEKNALVRQYAKVDRLMHELKQSLKS